jgi:hypothetical protein
MERYGRISLASDTMHSHGDEGASLSLSCISYEDLGSVEA